MPKRFIGKNSTIHWFIVEKTEGTLLVTSRMVSTTWKTCSSTNRTAFRTKNSSNGCFSSVLCSLPPTGSESDSTNVHE